MLSGSSEIVNASINVPIDWRPFNASPKFCYFAIPDKGVAFNKNQWFVDVVNQGAIGGPSNLFGNPVTVVVLGQNYLVWITNYLTQFNNICSLNKV
jgi:hypothetical protein